MPVIESVNQDEGIKGRSFEFVDGNPVDPTAQSDLGTTGFKREADDDDDDDDEAE